MATITGTNLSEILNGTALADLIRGLDGNDSLDGGAADDSLDGGAGNDTLIGGTGGDQLTGGAGNDVYYVDSLNDKLIELANGGSDLVYAGVSWTLAGEVEHLTLTGASKLNGTGNALANLLTGNGANNALFGLGGADTLVGGAGNDTLDGGAGNDRLEGGAGDDVYYVDSSTDQLIEAASAGSDLVYATVSHTLSLNVEKLTLQGSAAIDGAGNALANTLIGNTAANRLTGLDGNDSLDGGAGNDTLAGGNGNDTLQGGLGNDSLDGGAGNDSYYVDSVGDQVAEGVSGGTDKVTAAVSYSLAANLENLTLTGGALTATGNALANILIATAANNTLSGLDGNDSLDGGAGNDTLVGGNGDDTLQGGLGSDRMEGGAGNDSYYVDALGDQVTESLNAGTDRVYASISYLLGANLENLSLTGTAAIDGVGNALGNTLTGNTGANNLVGLDGNDSLDGGTGNDTLTGGFGNDTLKGGLGDDHLDGGAGDDLYYVDTVGDRVVEAAAGGIDRVSSAVSFTLGNELENLWLTGSAALTGTGNALANDIGGNAGATLLLGLGGNDNLYDGTGNDTLDGGEGNDSLSGGLGNDQLIGGAGNDSLDGNTGNDTLTGGAGNDSYYVDSVLDVISEDLGGGDDRVYATVSLTLAANLEQLTLTGTAAINGTGNDLANLISGNAAANSLDGGIGDDTLIGGAGNDSLDGGGGADVIYPDPDRYYPIILGNDSILAGDGSDTVDGGTGNDFIDGGTGNDLLWGDRDEARRDGFDGNGYPLFGDDTILGGDGNDTIHGGWGSWWSKSSEYYTDGYIDGGTGNDVIYAIDVDYGPGGYRSYDSGQAFGSTTVYGGTGNDTVYGTTGGNLVHLGAGDDHYQDDFIKLSIWNQEDTYFNAVYGEDGNDRIETFYDNPEDPQPLWLRADGGLGDDTLLGGEGYDTLIGGPGVDELRGAKGNDLFVFGQGDIGIGSARETIDFNKGYVTDVSDFDRIDLSAIDASTLLSGDQDFTFIGTAAFTVPGQVRVYAESDVEGDVVIISLNMDNDSAAEAEIVARGSVEAYDSNHDDYWRELTPADFEAADFTTVW